MAAIDFSSSLHRHSSRPAQQGRLPGSLLCLAEEASGDAGLGIQVPPPVNRSCLTYPSSTQQKKSNASVH